MTYPVCGGKTRIKIRTDTVLINFLLFCPKCRKVSTVRFYRKI
ncbi:cysteine-rich KTR domain-containing protein [Olsenella profusa]|nr:cysteine-rich KTR domain-containing protein [Olsenella profusa]